MSESLRRYFQTHGGSGAPLLELQRHLRRHGPPDPDGVQELAGRLGLPPAAVRGAISYYGDLTAPQGAVRVCHGTSCALSGAGGLRRALEDRTSCRTAYCIGYCDRSPAVLRGDDRVVVACEPERPEEVLAGPAEAPGPPRVRCTAPEPIVTRHLLGGGGGSGLAAAREAGVYRALESAVRQGPEAVLAAVERSGLRGRGGAGFPAGVKWRRCAEAPGERKYVVANGDEGDPGSFIDRVLMEEDPHTVLEGMALCGLAVGARSGVLFIRSEYPRAQARMEAAIAEARAAEVLGPDVLGSGFGFEVTVFPGMGSYVCGEETALLNAIEGFRGEVRLRPPYPTDAGLHGSPTVVNNVETLASVPWILERGPDSYRARGTDASAGTKVLCFNRGFARPGVVEVELGDSLARLIREEAGGGRDGGELAAVLLGGPMGSLLTPDEWEVPVCYGAMGSRGVILGHGGVVAVPRGTDPEALLTHLLEFMRHESCGKCVPCRLGSQRAWELARDPDAPDREGRLGQLFTLMEEASLCAFGQLMPGPLRRLQEISAAGGWEAARR